MRSDGPRGTILENLDEDALLDLYVEYKRADMVRMGMHERNIEQAIEIYVEWRRRYHIWERAERVLPTKTCAYCRRSPVQKSTSSGLICRVCFMTRKLCDIEGCKNVVITKSDKCFHHQQHIRLKAHSPVINAESLPGGTDGESREMDLRAAAIRDNLSGV